MRFLAGLVLLIPLTGCRDKHDDPASQSIAQALSAQLVGAQVASAQAAAASAQAMASAALAESQTTVTGTVHSVGGDLGTWDVVLSDCHSGQNSGFFGADFFAAGSDELSLRYVHDEAAGDVVKIAVPSKKGSLLVLDRNAKCSVLGGAIQKTNFNTWTPEGNVQHLKGHLKFDCTNSGGKGHVSGEATFSHCH
jgi:hypothetical protein